MAEANGGLKGGAPTEGPQFIISSEIFLDLNNGSIVLQLIGRFCGKLSKIVGNFVSLAPPPARSCLEFGTVNPLKSFIYFSNQRVCLTL